MTGRRRHERFAVTEPWSGALRVLRDVRVLQGPGTLLTAISQAPGVTGELMTLELAGAGAVATLRVQVVDSRPVVFDGGVRHELQLTVLDQERRLESLQPAAGE